MDIATIQQQAADYLHQGQYQEAIACYQHCVEIAPDVLSNHWYLGIAWLLHGDVAEAQAVWLAVIVAGTSTEEIEHWTADLLYTLQAEAKNQTRLGKLRQAKQIYEQILELDAESVEAHYSLGNVRSQQGDLDTAIELWQQAIDLNPNLTEAYQNQAEVFQRLEQYEAAIECYLKVLQPDAPVSSTRSYVTYNLGLCLARQNRLDEAITWFKQTIQIEPSFIPAYSDLGMVLLLQGNVDEAIAYLTYLNHSSLLSFNFVETYIHWGTHLEQQKTLDHHTQANVVLLQALSAEPVAVEAYRLLGDRLTKTANRNAAIAVYQNALKLHPNDDTLYLELGNVLAVEGYREQAIAVYQQALQLQPKSAVTYLKLGKLLLEQENFDEAIANYQRALELDITLLDGYFYWGNALSDNGHWNEAIACYQHALTLKPDSFYVLFRLGIAFAETNQEKNAIICFQSVLNSVPELAQTVSQVAENLYHQGKLGQNSANNKSWLPVDIPDGFYETTRDWAIASQLENSHYFSLNPTSKIELIAPTSIDETVDIRFRFGDELKLPAAFVAVVPDGRVWIQEQSKTAIITNDNKILGDVSPDFPILSPGHPDKHPCNHSIFELGKLPPAYYAGASAAVFSGLFNNAYFHWMFDVLPRIGLLRRSPINIHDIDAFLVNSRLSFQQETLGYFEIPQSRCLEPVNYPHIQAKNLIVPSFPASISWMPKWTCNFLRETVLDRSLESGAIANLELAERLYISRSQTTNRRIINEDEVVDLLQQSGFKCVALESMTVIEQAALLNHANAVIAPHGGGLTNIVFCNPGTKIIELFSPNYVYPCYWLISNLVQLDYYYLLGDVPLGFYLNQLLHPDPRTEDIFININQLIALMKRAGID